MKRLLVSLAVFAVLTATTGDALAKKQPPQRIPVVIKNDRQDAVPIHVTEPLKVELSGHHSGLRSLSGTCESTCKISCFPEVSKLIDEASEDVAVRGLSVTLDNSNKLSVLLSPNGAVSMISTRYGVSPNHRLSNWSIQEGWSCKFPGVRFSGFTPE